MSLYLMCKHFGEDKWLGQKKLPAMIIWKKNLKKSPSCIISLEHWLPIWISHILLRAIRPEAAGIKKRKSSQKRDDGLHFEIERWTKKISWNGNQEKPEKKTSLHHPKSLSSSANFLAPTTKPLERKRSVSVVSFFGPNVEPSSLLPRPKTATPVVPSSRKNSKQHKMKNLSQTVIIIRYYFFSSSSLSHFFLKIVTTFSFALLISRSVLFPLSPPCFHASEMADRFSSSP